MSHKSSSSRGSRDPEVSLKGGGKSAMSSKMSTLSYHTQSTTLPQDQLYQQMVAPFVESTDFELLTKRIEDINDYFDRKITKQRAASGAYAKLDGQESQRVLLSNRRIAKYQRLKESWTSELRQIIDRVADEDNIDDTDDELGLDFMMNETIDIETSDHEQNITELPESSDTKRQETQRWVNSVKEKAENLQNIPTEFDTPNIDNSNPMNISKLEDLPPSQSETIRAQETNQTTVSEMHNISTPMTEKSEQMSVDTNTSFPKEDQRAQHYSMTLSQELESSQQNEEYEKLIQKLNKREFQLKIAKVPTVTEEEVVDGDQPRHQNLNDGETPLTEFDSEDQPITNSSTGPQFLPNNNLDGVDKNIDKKEDIISLELLANKSAEIIHLKA